LEIAAADAIAEEGRASLPADTDLPKFDVGRAIVYKVLWERFLTAIYSAGLKSVIVVKNHSHQA